MKFYSTLTLVIVLTATLSCQDKVDEIEGFDSITLAKVAESLSSPLALVESPRQLGKIICG